MSKTLTPEKQQDQKNQREERDQKNKKEEKLEMSIWVSIAILAALLSVNELVGGEFEEEQMISVARTTEMYNRYNSKSIKQTIVKWQHDFIESLVENWVMHQDVISWMSGYLQALGEKADRYQKEKTEILLWSQVVGEENRAQDINGEMWVIIWSQERSQKVDEYNALWSYFDIASFVFQVGLVFGAISIIFKTYIVRVRFRKAMIVLWGIATLVSAIGMIIGFSL